MGKIPTQPQAGSLEHAADGRLESWKEIAAYLKRDVRTVQRWEKNEGLPVHRHLHDKLGTVYAYKPELDLWWNNGRVRLEGEDKTLVKAQPRGGRPWLWTIGLAVFALATVLVGLKVRGWRSYFPQSVAPLPIRSIAVLPLENLSGDASQEYFADGITEALISNLGEIKGLRVISRTSASRYKAARKPLPEIARELRVDGVLEGSIVRSGTRLHITVRLVDAATDQQLWAQSYRRDLGDVLALQNEIARAVAREIDLTVLPSGQATVAKTRRVDPAAHEAYLRGRYFWSKRSVEALNRAVEYFQRAIDVDPTFAPAYAGLGDAYTMQATWYGRVRDRLPKAKAAAEKAVELDEGLAEAHASLGYVRGTFEWDWPAAEREFRRAIELNPNYVTGRLWYGVYLSNLGRTEEALAEIRKALELDPFSLNVSSALGRALLYGGRYDQAIEQYRKVIEMDPQFDLAHLGPDEVNLQLDLAHARLGEAYLHKGMYERAVEEFQKAPRRIGGAGMAYAYAAMGKKREARRIIQQTKPDKGAEDGIAAYGMAVMYTSVGEKAQAFAWLEKAFEARTEQLVYLKVDPRFVRLRSDSRYRDLLRRMNIPE